MDRSLNTSRGIGRADKDIKEYFPDILKKA